MKTILVTGGTGFIGSHTCVELLQAGYNVIILDNLVNSKESSIDRIKQITDRDVKFYKTDLLDFEGTKRVFEENDIDSVIHFAGLKAVGESVEKPLEYYENNIGGTLNLIKAMITCSIVASFSFRLTDAFWLRTSAERWVSPISINKITIFITRNRLKSSLNVQFMHILRFFFIAL